MFPSRTCLRQLTEVNKDVNKLLKTLTYLAWVKKKTLLKYMFH